MNRRARSLAALCALSLGACLYPETSPAETKTRIHANRDIVDTLAGESGSGLYDTTLYDAGSPAIYGFRSGNGNMDLFEYYHKYEDEIGVADDEYSEALYFLVPPGIEELRIDTGTFALYKPRYRPFGQFMSYGIVDSGLILVKKTGRNRYRVRADVGIEIRYAPGFFDDSTRTSRATLKFLREYRRRDWN